MKYKHIHKLITGKEKTLMSQFNIKKNNKQTQSVGMKFSLEKSS